MGEDSDAPTGYAPTELGAAIDETEAVTAWSLDDDEDWPPPRFSPRLITTLALAVSLALLAGAGALAYWHMQRPVLGDVAMLGSAGGLTGSAPDFDAETGFPDPPPPSTATVTVERPVPAAPREPTLTELQAQVAPYDRQFVANLRAQNWAIWDEGAIARSAHQACAKLSNGMTPWALQQTMVNDGSLTLPEAQSFVVTAMMVYPGCG